MPAWMRIVLETALRRDGRTHFQKPGWQPPSSGLRKGGISDYLRELRRQVSAHRRTILEAFRYLSLHFFAPGYEYFLVGVLSAGPFVICAVFLLLHLGLNDRLRPAQFSRRLAGVLGSLILMFGVSFWTHLSALMYPDAQGALVYFFLPYVLFVLLPLGYGLGRLILAFSHTVRPREEEPAKP